jgi:hypothetical protein
MRDIIRAGVVLLAAIPAFAQVDFAGNWAARYHQDWQDRAIGPDVVEYLGIPLSNAGRAKALNYDATILSLPERQCLYYTPPYLVIGPFPIKMWEESDPVTGKQVAWKIGGIVDGAGLAIWMDGRPHPAEFAPHSFTGFTTGRWDGDVLTTYTTHMKAGYLRRNGAPSSDQATMTLHFMRHGDILTITALIEDPVYLTEPDVISRTWIFDPSLDIRPTPSPCSPEVEVPRLDGNSSIPHFLPGKNPWVDEVAKTYNIPRETVLGGAETMYPEYRKKLKANYVAPEKCVRYCCGWAAERIAQATANVLGCISNGQGQRR